MKKALILSLAFLSLSSFADMAATNRRTIAKFFANYELMKDWKEFQRAQRRLLSSDIVTVASDHRGTRTYRRPEGYFQSLGDWSQMFATGPDFRTSFITATSKQVVVRLRGTLTLKKPYKGKMKLRDDEHKWTETFTMNPNTGRIEKLEVKMNLLP